jgi:glycosyltransferase involved in cell wall biosynthesis
MKILGLVADYAGCGYYRMQLPLGELKRRGHNVRISSKLLRYELDDVDVIVGQRVILPRITTMWQRLARENNIRLIYEIDDDLWNVPADNPARSLFCGHALRLLTANVEVAHAVIVTTESLAERVRPLNPNVFVLPNCIDESVLQVEHIDAAPGDPVRVGWQGSPTHRRDFKEVSHSLMRLLHRDSRVQFWTLGGNYLIELEPSARRLAKRIFAAPWVDQDWPLYYKRVSDMHIGLAPLATSIFNNSKSHIKALEYAALGIPCIASNEPPYRDIVQHGVTGFIVNREHEWLRCMQLLVHDDAARAEIGANARRHAEALTIQKNAHLWERVLTPTNDHSTINSVNID